MGEGIHGRTDSLATADGLPVSREGHTESGARHDDIVNQLATLVTQVGQWQEACPDEAARAWLLKARHYLILARLSLLIVRAIEAQLVAEIAAELEIREAMG